MIKRPCAKGFTLIEIIVVLIILGVIASIALPSLFGWVTKSSFAEGSQNLKILKDQIEGCVQGAGADVLKMSSCFTDNVKCVAGPGFCYEYNITQLNAQGYYVLYALRSTTADPYQAVAGDPCNAVHCSTALCSTIQLTNINQSGIQVCRDPSGSFTTTGWGMYSSLI